MQLSKEFKNVSLSHATMRAEDLIPAFSNFLRENDPEGYKQLLEEWRDALPHTGTVERDEDITDSNWINVGSNRENADYLLDDLFSYLNNLAPDNCYFGSHPGDGSDFGFWECEDEF